MKVTEEEVKLISKEPRKDLICKNKLTGKMKLVSFVPGAVDWEKHRKEYYDYDCKTQEWIDYEYLDKKDEN